MTTTLTVISAISLAVMCILHAVCSFIPNEMIAKILTFVNIALHIALILPMVIAGFNISLAVLFYMISVFCYALCSYIRYAIDCRFKREEADEK